MAKPRQILSGFILAVVLIGSGLMLGLYLSKPPAPSEDAPPATTSTPVAANPKLFQASPPHRGRAYRSVLIPINDVSGNQTIGYLPTDKAGKLAPGQSILLYDKDNALLDIIGHVTAVSHGKGDFAKITSVAITIDDTPATAARTVKSGAIIVEKFPVADRLPLSALVQPKDEKPYLWEAVKQADGLMQAIKRVPPKIDILNEDFFIYDTGDYVSNVYLLTPDDSLQDGQTITVEKTLYHAPDTGDDNDIAQSREQALSDYHQDVKDKPLRDTIKAGPAAACSSSCGPGAAAVTDFIAKVKSLGSQPAQP